MSLHHKLLTFLTAAIYSILFSASSFGCNMSLLGVCGSGAGAVSFSLTFQSSATGAAGTTVDYGTLSYGPGNTRVIVAAAYQGGAAVTVSGVTIGGVSLVHVAGTNTAPGGFATGSDIWISSSALGGTSGDVQVTYSSSPNFANAIAIYNLQTTTPAASNTNAALCGFGGTCSAAVTVPVGGRAIAAIAPGNAGTTGTLTNATQDAAVSTGGLTYYFVHTTSTGSVTPTETWSGSDTGSTSLAAWGP